MLSEAENDYEKAIALCERERVRSCRNSPDDCHRDWAVSGNNPLDEVIGASERDVGSHFGELPEANRQKHEDWLLAVEPCDREKLNLVAYAAQSC